VVVSVSNSDGALLPGMTATVDFEVAKSTDVLMVANAALRFRPTGAMTAQFQAEGAAAGGTSLWYVDAAGKTGVIPVRAGITNGKMTEVTPLGGRELPAGARAIAGVTSGPQEAATTNPFQNQSEGQPRGPRGPV
jgi:HlyD family secretion protein